MTGKSYEHTNPICNAPHTMQVVCADEWTLPYSRQKAAFPQLRLENTTAGSELLQTKYWPTISKIDDAYGDRNLQAVWAE
jgi:glycine dehydrogenase